MNIEEKDPLRAMAGLFRDAIGDQPTDAVELVKEARERDSLKPHRIKAYRRLGDYCKHCENWTPYEECEYIGKCTNEDSPFFNDDTSDLHSCQEWNQRTSTIHFWLELKPCVKCKQECYIPEDRDKCITCLMYSEVGEYGHPLVTVCHVWLPKRLFEAVDRLAEKRNKPIDAILVTLVGKALEDEGLI